MTIYREGHILTAEEDVIAGCIAAILALQQHSAAQLSMNHYLILFYVFLNDGITRTELIEQLPNAKKETIRRQVKDLIEENQLLTETENEMDYRTKHLHLLSQLNVIAYLMVDLVILTKDKSEVYP